MSATINVSIISPATIVYEGAATLVEIPGAEGVMGVMTEHAPTLTLLKEGNIVLHQADRTTQQFAVTGGYADVSATQCTILCEDVVAA